jgi:hypothetical protein
VACDRDLIGDIHGGQAPSARPSASCLHFSSFFRIFLGVFGWSIASCHCRDLHSW